MLLSASFTDDTDNSDEETDKAEEIELSDSQSLQPSVVETMEEYKTSDSEDKNTVDVVEVKVLVETPTDLDPVLRDIKDTPEIVNSVVEAEVIEKSEESELMETCNTDFVDREEASNKEEEKTSLTESTQQTSDNQVVEIKDESKIVQNVENVDIKFNEESSSQDKFEFREEENNTQDWNTNKQSDEDLKPRGRPRKTPNKTEVKKEFTPKDKKEVKKTKMTMAERKYMGQYPPCSEMEPPIKKIKDEEEVKDTNDEDTEEDDEMEKKKVKKKTKKKDTVDSDSSDVDHKKVVKKDTKVIKMNKSKKRLKESDDLDKRSLMSDDDSSVASEKCDTENPSDLTIKSVIEYKSSAETIEISEQTDITPGTFVNTPPTSPEQDTDTCVNQPHSEESQKNVCTEQNPLESPPPPPPGNTSPSSNDGSIGSGNVAGSDSSDVVHLGKRKKESDDSVPAKKKKRGKSKSASDKKSKPHGKICSVKIRLY